LEINKKFFSKYVNEFIIINFFKENSVLKKIQFFFERRKENVLKAFRYRMEIHNSSSAFQFFFASGHLNDLISRPKIYTLTL